MVRALAFRQCGPGLDPLTRLNEFLRNPKCFVRKQITIYIFFSLFLIFLFQFCFSFLFCFVLFLFLFVFFFSFLTASQFFLTAAYIIDPLFTFVMTKRCLFQRIGSYAEQHELFLS